MLKFVKRDNRVYTDTVDIHESKLVLVPQDLRRSRIHGGFARRWKYQSVCSPC